MNMEGFMADRVEINMSSIRIAGLGGLGMLVMVPVVAYGLPAARQFLLFSYGAGTLGALLFIAYRKWIAPVRPHGPTLIAMGSAAQPGHEHHNAAADAPGRFESSTHPHMPLRTPDNAVVF
jgi:hypothetical protein